MSIYVVSEKNDEYFTIIFKTFSASEAQFVDYLKHSNKSYDFSSIIDMLTSS